MLHSERTFCFRKQSSKKKLTSQRVLLFKAVQKRSINFVFEPLKCRKAAINLFYRDIFPIFAREKKITT